jgi:hypothetical protein
MKEAFQEIPFREGYFPFLQDHHRDTTWLVKETDISSQLPAGKDMSTEAGESTLFEQLPGND